METFFFTAVAVIAMGAFIFSKLAYPVDFLLYCGPVILMKESDYVRNGIDPRLHAMVLVTDGERSYYYKAPYQFKTIAEKQQRGIIKIVSRSISIKLSSSFKLEIA